MNVTSPTTFSDYGILLANWLQGQKSRILGHGFFKNNTLKHLL